MISRSLEETQNIAKDFLIKISEIKTDKAMVVCLYGDLGSGKTTFTQALARELGITEFVTSPTFVIEKKYSFSFKTLNLKSNTLIHIDAYRLEGGKEILNLNFADDLSNPENLVVIEWPEKISDALPEGAQKINFKFLSEFEREIDF